MVRGLAGFDHARAQAILRWPLREALIAYREKMRELALEDWRHRTLVWAAQSAFARRRPPAPAVPPILRMDDDDDDA